MLTVYVDMRILIAKALTYFYMLQESLILCKHGNILLSLKSKENTISNSYAVYILYTHDVQSFPSNEIGNC